MKYSLINSGGAVIFSRVFGFNFTHLFFFFCVFAVFFFPIAEVSCMKLTRVCHSKIMKAIRVHSFGGPEVLKVEKNVPIPELNENQVLIRVKRAGINPVDTYIRSGAFARSAAVPYIPGGDSAGLVEAIGSKVVKFKKGDRVFSCSPSSSGGASAEYVAAGEDYVFHLGDKLSFSQGAGIGIPYFTAYRALFQKAKARPSETVLVHGASGAVGLAAVQIAKSHGLTVFGTAGTKEGLDLVLENGADHVFNHREEGYIDKINSLIGGRGVDVIVEMLTNVNLVKDLDLLAPSGRLIVVGNRGRIEFDPRAMMAKETSITGMSLFSANENEWLEVGAAITAGIKSGWVRPVVDREYSMQDLAKAHVDIIESSGAKGNLVLNID